MNISYAAIIIAWEVVNGTKMPSDKPFEVAAKELVAGRHLDLLRACDNREVTQAYVYENTSGSIKVLALNFPNLHKLYPQLKEL